MNQSELEQRLKTDAQALDLRCPDTARQRALRKLEALAADRRRPPTWVPLSAAAVVTMAVAGAIWLSGQGRDQVPAPRPPLAAAPPVSSTEIDRAVASRESDLAAEARRIQSDLERIRRLVADA